MGNLLYVVSFLTNKANLSHFEEQNDVYKLYGRKKNYTDKKKQTFWPFIIFKLLRDGFVAMSIIILIILHIIIVIMISIIAIFIIIILNSSIITIANIYYLV